ncbi:MAG: hypothetical protein KDI47_13530, partial [Gammaproteobacteria bacterium]|nr:hypothetical protein [Gammaproteobacteria bacterium]
SNVLTESIAASPSISSIFNYPYSVDSECDHYRTGFQNRILPPVSDSGTIKKMLRVLAQLAKNSAT